MALALVTTAITACTPAGLPTRVPLPTFSGAADAPTSLPIADQSAVTPAASAASDTLSEPPLPEADRLLLEQPLGADKLALTFYADPDGRPCLRYAVSPRSDFQPVSACAASAQTTLVALQGIGTDTLGAAYSIVAGRVLDERITAVSIEFSDGDNTPAEVKNAGSDAGFVVILPGKHAAVRAIPIDQYGNLVGSKFTFR
jgi:hypothetical protein